ncbi:hypothetical protein [Sphaerisporangium sp. TRM90804]|uniref:hypothetical protein n=1 Tax=Sphaerisporangium sp. TRM90804 TaxID=3031113 RepID=UPI00244B777E|nr:hypothetical protein [Sphaerisporangium sp. TRM90804]MDH2425778.1 hypothetical protein [Sphaerisporangium sp. TRM90804]
MTLWSELRGNNIMCIQVPAKAINVAGEPTIQAPQRGTIIAATWTPAAAITANATNYFTLTFRNRGQAGAGTVQWATARLYNVPTTGDSVANVPEALTLHATLANRDVAAGDLLSVHITHTASGLAVPDGVVAITWRLR